jgi:hypothetical protein
VTHLCRDSLEIVARMSGPELLAMAGRNVALPPAARRRLDEWMAAQAADAGRPAMAATQALGDLIDARRRRRDREKGNVRD